MDIDLIRGDDATVLVPGVPADSAWAAFTVKRSVDDDDTDALLRKDSAPGGGVTLEADGAHVVIVPGDTDHLRAPVLLVWDLEAQSPAGLARTYGLGTLRIVADVTRNPGHQPGSGS